MSKKGKVYLVGAGPGDPGLITVRGRQLLRSADTVIFDALVPEYLLNEVKPGCLLINAGKRSGHHSIEQSTIIRWLIREAKKRKEVVRLKGGDPLIFGRGSEEGEALCRAGIPFEFVPGVTSATAVPAYSGIPLTDRRFNSTVTFVTGHGRQQGSAVGPAPLDWGNLAKQEVLVILMGLSGLAQNMRALVRHGKDPKTPAAVIQWGSRPEQRTVVGTLASIASKVRAAKMAAPAIVMVGDNVLMRKQLNWFEKKPLFGKHILVTRSREQASHLSEKLMAEGAYVSEVPTIDLVPPRSWAALDKSLRMLGDFEWVIFTSVNGVDAFFERLAEKGQDTRSLGCSQVAAIGPMTAVRLESYGVRADLVAKEFKAEGLLAKLPASKVRGRRVLIARAERAREILPDQLRKRGADVTVVPCYRAVVPADSRVELKRLMKELPPDLITFASSSTVESFVNLLRGQPALLRAARKIPVACIGPITAATARKHRLKVAVEPKQYTISALAQAITKYAR